MTPREFFETAREASRDAERCQTQLKTLRARMMSLGGSSGQRVSSTPEHDRMDRRVAAYVDRERMLEERMERDYDCIDRACVVLYGDGTLRGLDEAMSPVWADVLWWRYLDDAGWQRVASAVGQSDRTCREICSRALSWMAESGFMGHIVEGG